MSRPTCVDCGKIINYYAKHCISCDYKLRSDRQLGNKNPVWKGGRPKCKCGKQLSNYHAKNCKKCSGLLRRGINKLEKICKQCGKGFKTYTKTQYLCSVNCRINYFWGKNSPRWNGGKSFELYPQNWVESLREVVRKRDNYKCKICGLPQQECFRKLDIHHIDYDKKNCNINNLISLCHRCHIKTNSKRIEWENKLKEISNGVW